LQILALKSFSTRPDIISVPDIFAATCTLKKDVTLHQQNLKSLLLLSYFGRTIPP